MEIEQLEQIAAVIVTAGLVAGNFLMFTPWRNGEDPRQRKAAEPDAPERVCCFRSPEGVRHAGIPTLGFVISLG